VGAAQAEGGAKATLNLLFRHAIETGKRARTETSIGKHTASVSHAAVEMATERLGSLAGRSVLVVGAGEMGEGVAVALVGAGASNITVTNRTEERAMQLAQRVGGCIVPFSEMAAALRQADVLLTCTGAGTTIIDHDLVVGAREGLHQPLLIVDIAVPRDVAADVQQSPHVTLLNLDHLPGPPQPRRGCGGRPGAPDRRQVERFLEPRPARPHPRRPAHEGRERQAELGVSATTRHPEGAQRAVEASLRHRRQAVAPGSVAQDAGTPQGEPLACCSTSVDGTADAGRTLRLAAGVAHRPPRKRCQARGGIRPGLELVFVERWGSAPACPALHRRPGRVRQRCSGRCWMAPPTSPPTARRISPPSPARGCSWPRSAGAATLVMR
jgi:threonine dehydrogenase-like Zn-dependent dehydrogenase